MTNKIFVNNVRIYHKEICLMSRGFADKPLWPTLK